MKLVLRRSPPLLVLLGMVCAVGVTLLFFQGTSAAVPDDKPDAPVDRQPNDMFDAAKVEGPEKCIDCHRAEYARWLNSRHAPEAYDMLRTHTRSRDMVEDLIEDGNNLGIQRFADVVSSKSICVTCHATPQVTDGGHRRVLAGVTCESCHNPSGGEDGWLNIHAVYGPSGTTRLQESKSHFEMRSASCRKAGQLRSTDTYELVKRCFECHVIGIEELVNKTDHPSADGTWTFPEDMLGRIRHNFHLDQSINAEVATLWTDPHWHGKNRTAAGRKRVLFVVGALVDLEISLRYLARATDDEEDYFEDMAERVIDAYEFLEDDVVDELDDGLPLVEDLLEELEDLYDVIDEEELSLDDDREALLQAAAQVSAAARKFAANSDGSELADLEEPEVPDDE